MKQVGSCLAVILALVSACAPAGDATPASVVTPEPTRTPAITSTREPTLVPATPTATVMPTTPVPTPERGLMPTLTAAEVLPDQALWTGSIVPVVFAEMSAHLAEQERRLLIGEADGLFWIDTQPLIVSAVLYERSPGGPRHARLLFYEPGGRIGDETLPPFLYKMDLPLAWIGGHEAYGQNDQIRGQLAAQFTQPILPNRLRFVAAHRGICGTEADRQLTLCDRLAAEGVAIPADAVAARALILDPWRAAVAASPANPAEMLAYVEDLADLEWTWPWWDDPRVILFAADRVSLCPEEGGGECYPVRVADLVIDSFGASPLLAVTPERAPFYARAEAQATLTGFLDALAAGDYEAAASVYVGSYGPILFRGTYLYPNDPAGLLRAMCANVEAYACLPIDSVLSAVPEIDHWQFWVDLRRSNGIVFTYQGCCGPDGISPTARTEFSFQVVWAEGRFWVANLPGYAPPVTFWVDDPAQPQQVPEALTRQRLDADDLPVAQQTLIDYLTALHTGDYARAAELYVGPYAGLRDWNPSLAADNYPGLLKNACEINGLQCLTVRRVLRTDVVVDEIRFLIEFTGRDGSLFVRGPCCGASEADIPPVSQWTLRLIKTAGGYRVLDLPPYVP